MGKDKKGSKRGGKIYIENAEEMEIQEAKFRENQLERAKRRQEEDDDEEEDKNNNEVDQVVVESVAKVSITKAKPEVTKNKSIIQNDPMQTEEVGMSRREREAIEAIERKAEYDRRHLAGETEQAKADLARLAIVKQRREEARLKREAEGRAPGYSARGIESSSEDEDSDEDNNVKTAPVAVAAPVLSEVAAKKKAIATAEVTDKGVDTETKLKAIDIKKMNADALKEHLKARNLDIQGQKKDLMKRLIDYEAAR